MRVGPNQGAPVQPSERAWLAGVALLELGERDRASSAFNVALGLDPTAADSWLGVHATDVDRRSEAVKKMAATKSSFGGLRSKFGKRLASRFDIGAYVSVPLESSRDLWFAVVAELLNERQLDAAWEFLAPAPLDRDTTRFLTTRYALLRQDWTMILRTAHGISDPFLREESQLCVALALICQDVCYEALEVLEPLPDVLADNRHFHAEVAFGRGLAYEQLGDADTALRQFQSAYRYSPDYPTLAERIKVAVATTPATETSTSSQGAGDDPTPASTTTSPDALLAEAMNQLDSMVGLEPVKRQIRTLSAQLRMAQLRRTEGLSATVALRHFVFAGPPGTGKTTVARIIGKILAGLGMLEHGDVIETHRVDLVGQYLGETAIKTTKVIDSALGGVLFIDEAYALANSGYMHGDAYGDEALQVLLKRAEDDRDRLVIILAGYPEEMTELLSANPGLASRFTTHVEFPSYDDLELFQIALDILDAQADVLTKDSAGTLADCCTEAVDEGLIDRLGNARFIRELCAKAAARRDLRIADQFEGTELPTREDLTTLNSADITEAFLELLEATTPPPPDRTRR